MFESNQIFAAPMAGITDRPFRQIIRRLAPDVNLVTEMISSHSIVGGHKNCARNFDRYEDEGNIGAQIFGADAAIMAEAARILAGQGAKWIDINMGCPVPKVATRAGAGAYLMRDHKLAGQIVKAVARAVDIPVSIKTRLGWDDAHRDWADLVRIAADNGAAFATLHGRTRAAGYTGAATHPVIVDMPIPIIANGDIKSIDEKFNGYAGIMIGRAMLGKPWIFSRQSQVVSRQIVLEHFELVLEYYGCKTGVPLFRKHAAWYSAGMPGSSEFRVKVNGILDSSEMKQAIKQFFI